MFYYILYLLDLHYYDIGTMKIAGDMTCQMNCPMKSIQPVLQCGPYQGVEPSFEDGWRHFPPCNLQAWNYGSAEMDTLPYTCDDDFQLLVWVVRSIQSTLLSSWFYQWLDQYCRCHSILQQGVDRMGAEVDQGGQEAIGQLDNLEGKRNSCLTYLI